MRVLLTDGQQRKTLAVARSLGSRGIEVLAAEETRFAPALFSKYCHKTLVSPSPSKSPEQYWQWLQQTWRQYRFDLLLPMDDHSLQVIMAHKAELSDCCRLLLPPLDSYLTSADKARTVEAANELGIYCPKTFMPRSMEQLDELAAILSFPVVIKPRKSSGSRGISLVKTPLDFSAAYRRTHASYPWPLIQDCIPQGEKYDVCLLYSKDSVLKAAFVQKEIRFFPLQRGPSTVQESCHYPELIAIADRLLTRLGWQGIAEVEFMVDPRNGQPCLMEINPRFWGSLACSIYSGVDFPWLFYQLAVNGNCETVLNYPVGVRCRWLLPGDTLHFLTNPQRSLMDPPFITMKKHGMQDDILSWDDPLPTLGFVLACMRYALDPQMWKMMFMR